VDKHLIMYRLKPLLKRRMAEGLLNRETYKQARGCADLGGQLRLVLGGGPHSAQVVGTGCLQPVSDLPVLLVIQNYAEGLLLAGTEAKG
jgi:hypothetical protein